MSLINDCKIAYQHAVDNNWLPFFNKAAQRHQIKVEALLAIASRETNCRNIKGDGGHGRGIMQIDDRYHKAFLDAHNEGLDPESNIDYGASILKANLNRFIGDYHKAFAAYNSGIGNVTKAIQRGLSPDAYTTGKDYGKNVLERMDIMEGLINAKSN